METYKRSAKAFEKRLILHSMVWPAIFVAVMWLVKAIELISDVSFSEYGMAPRNLKGLYGILTYPFLHKDFSHLSANSAPLFILGTALFYYYREAGRLIFLQLFLISGLWLWVLGDYGSIHIGASGLVYGLTAFHITAGIIKRNKRLMAFALLVLFLYGSFVWGIFPDFFPHRNISWEGHLTGLIAGVVLAWYHRGKGPQRDRYQWEWDELEEEDDDDENNAQEEYYRSDSTYGGIN
jgi:membrane associated rhomboid family serine protease